MKSICPITIWLLATWGAVAGADAQDWKALEESERLFHKGMSHFQGEEYESAVEDFSKSAAQRPAYFQSLYFLGLSYARLGDYQRGAAALSQALSLPLESLPRFADLERAYFLPVRVDLAVAYYFLQRYAEALDQLEAAEGIDPSNPYVHFYRGMCLLQTASTRAEFDAAAASLHKAAQLDPGLAQEAVRQEGLALKSAQRLEEAYNMLRSSQKRWRLRFRLGADYDTNLVLEPEQGPFFGQLTEKEDIGFAFLAGAQYSFWQGVGGYLTASYDFSQSLYAQADEFNFQGHTARVAIGHHFSPRFTFGAEGGLEHYRLGGESYLRQIYLQPFVGFFTKPRLYSLISYRVDDSDYRISFFDPDRDGSRQAVSARQHILLGDFDRTLFVGYRFERESPESSLGDDFRYHSSQIEAGFRLPLQRSWAFEAEYTFRNFDYEFPSSLSASPSPRSDNGHQILLQAQRPLGDSWRVSAGYRAVINHSNLAEFEYRRQTVWLSFEFVY